MLRDETKKTWALKKKEEKTSKLGGFSKPKLIFQTCSSWNLRSELNQEALFPAN
jgi:hypothetical protein